MKKKSLLKILLPLILLLLIFCIYSNYSLTVSRYTVSSPEIPESFSGYRIAQVSDLHNARFGKENQRLLSLLRQESPDLILLTGDLVDSRKTDIDVGIAFGASAAAIAPTVYVTGNHESRLGDDFARLKDGLLAGGVTVLQGETLPLKRGDDQITLVGIDDPGFTGTPEMEAILHTLMAETDGYTILLAHRPERIGLYAEAGADLVFSGHAHGGQFRLPFIGGLYAPGQGLFPAYDAGLYTVGDTTLIVSRGLGNSLFPLRLFNRPELTITTLSLQ